jgi:hypothetical protein
VLDLFPGSTPSLSAGETVVEERERFEHIEAVERDFLSFLNGQVMAIAPFHTDFLRDVALLEITEDLVELVSIEFTIMQNLSEY